ncbi:hypothetical protein ACHAPT_012080 [Fusarium lateritium]
MIRFETGDVQSKSPFFTKLNPDVRREILLLLFGSRHVHIKLSSSRCGCKDFKRQNHPPLTYVGWLHCVCRSGAKGAPHMHWEEDHKWRYLSARMLRTCKRAFEEGTPLLYGTNTLMFENSLDFVNFNILATDYTPLIRSPSFCIILGGPPPSIRIRVADQLFHITSKEQREKVRQEARRVFGRALTTLLEDGRAEIEVVRPRSAHVEEIIEPDAFPKMARLTFVKGNRYREIHSWTEDDEDNDDQELDSDDEFAFYELVDRAHESHGRLLR